MFRKYFHFTWQSNVIVLMYFTVYLLKDSPYSVIIHNQCENLMKINKVFKKVANIFYLQVLKCFLKTSIVLIIYQLFVIKYPILYLTDPKQLAKMKFIHLNVEGESD